MKITRKSLLAVCASALLATITIPRGATAQTTSSSAVTVTSPASVEIDDDDDGNDEVSDASDRGQEARDREQEARDREQEARDRQSEQREREQEKKDHEQEKKDHERERIDQRNEAEENMYDSGTDLLDEHEYRQAVHVFRDVAAMKLAHADAAMYWTAYAQNKLGQSADALATIADLEKSYPNSRWNGDARALEVQIRQSSGQKVAPEKMGQDEDLKLMAINSLMGSDPERAIPLLESVLKGSASVKVKDRALFVLSQSGEPRAHQILAEVARGRSNPSLQSHAVRYLGIVGGESAMKELSDVYATSSDAGMKRTILKSFMIAGDRARIFTLAKSEQNPDLRGEAVRALGVLGAKDQIGDLYMTETSLEVKKQILQAMFISGSRERLAELARSEKDLDLRLTAIRDLALIGSSRTGVDLVAIYNDDHRVEVRHAVIQGLFIQGNAKALVQLARAEKDPEMKSEIVRKLSLIDSSDTREFMIDMLKD